jgi:hypothetical protein
MKKLPEGSGTVLLWLAAVIAFGLWMDWKWLWVAAVTWFMVALAVALEERATS